MKWIKAQELGRMAQWLLLALVLYALALVTTQPQLQTALWKLGHITLGAFAGYWVDRNLYGRLSPESAAGRVIARAVIVAAAVLGMAFGL